MIRNIFSVLVIAGATLVVVKNYYLPFYNRATAPPPEKIIATVKNNEVESPDGTMKVIMQTKRQADGNIFYSIFTEKASGENKQLLYATTSAQVKLTLSPNSWSPDNAYVFIIKQTTDAVDGLVFKVDNKSASNNQPYIISKENITDITGWDSPTLLHVKIKGATYWFDVTTKTFIKLS